MAAEAVENLLAGMDVEAGCLLLVEWAEGGEVGTGSLEGKVAADDLDNIAGGTNLLDRRLGDQPGHEVRGGRRATGVWRWPARGWD